MEEGIGGLSLIASKIHSVTDFGGAIGIENTGVLYQYVLSSLNSHIESKVNSDRQFQTHKKMLRDGEYPFTGMPKGFYVKYDERGRVGGKLKDEAVAPKITELFNLYAYHNYSLADLIEWAEVKNLKNKKGNKYDKGGIGKILKNKFYIGIIETREGSFKHKYERLTDPETFEIVQNKLAGKNNRCANIKKQKKTRSSEVPRILDGIATCGVCGHKIGVSPTFKKNGHIINICYCSYCKKHNGGKTKYVDEKRYEPQIIDSLSNLYVPEQDAQKAMDILIEWQTEQFISNNQELVRTEGEKTRLEKQIAEGREKVFLGDTGSITIEKAEEIIHKKELELDRVNKRIDDLKSNKSLPYINLITIQKIINMLPEIYSGSNPEQKNMILKLSSSNLSIENEKLDITLINELRVSKILTESSDMLGCKDSNLD